MWLSNKRYNYVALKHTSNFEKKNKDSAASD